MRLRSRARERALGLLQLVEDASAAFVVGRACRREREPPGGAVQVVNLEALSKDRVYTFAFIAASLKLRGASGAPLRPIALPIRG